ncbi:ABC transporter substrate-binding protein [Rhodoferax ferrireducens]|uniref:ABC transporter substrate-binding protein n=1 Tax=Rhodoferax ferrireducens TaxID=192843 RepID=UPI000E0DE590|nr:ABC transporter substrate-binding protein [Rhodoferax ferrireducens]
MKRQLPRHLVLSSLLLLPLAGQAAERLNVLCAADSEWCELMRNAFVKETQVEVSMVRKSSGEIFAQIRAEASNPKTDIWWAGTGDPHLQAAGDGFTEVYKSPQLDQLQPWAQKQAENSGYRTVGIYAGLLGIGYNPEVLKQKNVPAPKCWKDLINPAYKGEVQIANPNSSGTAYTTIATLVQLQGENEAFAFMKKMNDNVSQYTKSGSAPAKALARGETAVGVTFQHDLLKEAIAGFPVSVVSPCEGTGYEIGSMSIVKGAKNMAAAKRFYEFALRPEVQSLAVKAGSFQVPSNKTASIPPQAPRLESVKTINYDFAKYGSDEVRRRLLKRWDDEIFSLPR